MKYEEMMKVLKGDGVVAHKFFEKAEMIADINLNIIYAMHDENISVSELANRTHIKTKRMWKIYNLDITPTLEELATIMVELGLTLKVEVSKL